MQIQDGTLFPNLAINSVLSGRASIDVQFSQRRHEVSRGLIAAKHPGGILPEMLCLMTATLGTHGGQLH